MARAYSFLTGQCCDVGSKRNTPFVFDDCMYYGDDDVTIDASKGGNMSYNKFHEGGYDEGAFQDTWIAVIMVFVRLRFSCRMWI